MDRNDRVCEANRVIDALGGITKVSKMFCITTASVAEWRRNGIPPARRMFLEVKHPELFRGDVDSADEGVAA